MKIEICWRAPIQLDDGTLENLIYTHSSEIPDSPGIYIFARKHGDTISPLYIGQTKSFSSRLKMQFNNTKLMKGIEKAPVGRRILLLGEVIPQRGQNIAKVLRTVETTLIEYCLANKADLINIQGTRTNVDTITHTGSNSHKKLFPSLMSKKAR